MMSFQSPTVESASALGLPTTMPLNISTEIQYVVLVFCLFIVPRGLQRFRLPSAVTCVVLGAAVSIGFHGFHDDATVKLLATLGIVSMFLFAGLEVDFAELSGTADANVTLSLSSPAHIRGIVQGEDGLPRSGIRVVASSQRADVLMRPVQTLTDGEGGFALPVAPGGNYLVEALAAVGGEVALANDRATRMVDVTTESVDGVNLVLVDRDASISGRVLDAQGNPLDGALVEALERGQVTARALTSSDGSFSLVGLVAGELGLRAYHSAFALTTITTTAPATDVPLQLTLPGPVASTVAATPEPSALDEVGETGG